MSRTNNKTGYGIFSSIKETFKKYREEIKPNLQAMIIIGMAVGGLTFCVMDVKRNSQKVILSVETSLRGDCKEVDRAMDAIHSHYECILSS